jgi:hypothetical protein
MSAHAEGPLGFSLMAGTVTCAALVLLTRVTVRRRRRMVEAPVLAGVLAYVFYVGAALIAQAKFPEFLREHLFDGLAPAAVVGLLINSFFTGGFPIRWTRIRRPAVILVAFFAFGALIFGLIAAAAVFASGTGYYFGQPIVWPAWLGGVLFAMTFFLAVAENFGYPSVKWWFTKRPESAVIPKPGGSDDYVTTGPADGVSRERRAPAPDGDSPASTDARQDAVKPLRADKPPGASDP